MNTRRTIAAFFVVLCLVLCGLVLRRQVIAHPLPPQVSQQESAQLDGNGRSQDGNGMLMGGGDWHAAPEKIRQEAKETIQGQLQAFRAGDGQKAMSYQSRRMQRMFGNPAQFMQMIDVHYPGFGHWRSAQFGTILSDQEKICVRVPVALLGENDHRIYGEYLLVREQGQLRIFGVQVEPPPE